MVNSRVVPNMALQVRDRAQSRGKLGFLCMRPGAFGSQARRGVMTVTEWILQNTSTGMVSRSISAGKPSEAVYADGNEVLLRRS